MLAYWISILRRRRVGRWARRTVWLLAEMWADFGLGGGSKPVWLRDNPFLLKTSRAEVRRPGLSLRLAVTIAALGGLLVWGMSLGGRPGFGLGFFLRVMFQVPLSAALFAVTAIVHLLLITNARTAGATVLADEARRVTLPDLLMTPLRRAEMLLAMAVGPARSAFLVALSGLPVYLLLGQLGGMTGRQTACLYVLFALLCFQPPQYAVPALSGMGQTPDAAPGQFAPVQSRRGRRRGVFGAGFPLALSFLFLAQALGVVGGGWLVHLFAALHLPGATTTRLVLFLNWPVYATRLLADTLPFFHRTLSPLWYVLPLAVMQWMGSALSSASALSAGSADEMRRLPLWTRAQTVTRWTARLLGFCALAVVWRAWVESGDMAGLAGLFASGPGWNAAGLLTLLGGVSLPNVYSRALATDPRQKRSGELRSPGLVLRRALKRSLRPLGVALVMFGLVCACGGLSPFAAPVGEAAGKIALAGLVTAVWAVGVRRAVPKIGAWASAALLYGVPLGALAVPGGSVLAALSPASVWVRLFAGGPALISRFPWRHLEPLPSFEICVAGPLVVGLALMTIFGRRKQPARAGAAAAAPAKRAPARNEAQTAMLMAWITRRTDNPLFLYEMRARTRSGRWFNGLVLAPLGFAGVIALAVAYPAFVDAFSGVSPFQFFPSGSASPAVWPALASLLLAAQCYGVGFRGQTIGDRLIAKDREQGTWGFLLISPLPMRQIFWGKVWGQTAAVDVVWAGAGLACFVLYGLSVPQVGLGPALGAWAAGQIFVGALFVLGVALGTALATFPGFQKTLKGGSTLLFVLVIGASAYAEYQLSVFDLLGGGWQGLARILIGNSVYALALAAGLFWAAERRLSVLRGRDVAAGDGTG